MSSEAIVCIDSSAKTCLQSLVSTITGGSEFVTEKDSVLDCPGRAMTGDGVAASTTGVAADRGRKR